MKEIYFNDFQIHGWIVIVIVTRSPPMNLTSPILDVGRTSEAEKKLVRNEARILRDIRVAKYINGEWRNKK